MKLFGDWLLSSSSDPAALAVVDGLGRFAAHGPHYSRRTPGSKTFTGCGQEIVLLHQCGAAVWAVVYQRTPARAGSGSSRGRLGEADAAPRFVWRNMLFRRLPECREERRPPHDPPCWSLRGCADCAAWDCACRMRTSRLIKYATASTYAAWRDHYGSLPAERLRTEIEIGKVKSQNPGYCYKAAGWVKDRVVRGKLYLWAPEREEIAT